MHKEYFYKNANSDTAVLFIHGILGSPNSFADLIRALKNRYTVLALLLPGHGGTARAFSESAMAQWENCVETAVKKLAQKYQNLILVGHSMGCLLAMQAAAATSNTCIKGLFLTAVPLHMQLTPSSASNSLKVVFNRVRPNDTLATAAKNACSVDSGQLLEHLRWLPRFFELLKKARQCRTLPSQLSIPVLVFQSRKDELVARRSAKHFIGKPNYTLKVLENSRHYYYHPQERAQMADALVQFVEQVSK